MTYAEPGKKECCLCFELIPIDKLYVDPDGVRWDVCVPCKDWAPIK